MSQKEWVMIPVSRPFKEWLKAKTVGKENFEATLRRLIGVK